VAALREQPASLLTLYRRLIELRRAEPALSVGEFAPLPAREDLFAYVRKAGERRLAIILNLGPTAKSFNLAELESRPAALLSTHLDRGREELGDTLDVRGDEGLIIELS
jgi:alpha-glucosidase